MSRPEDQERDAAVIRLAELSEQDRLNRSRYSHSGTQLAEYLRELAICLKRYISRYGRRMLQASGTLNDLYVSVEEANTLLGSSDTSKVSEEIGARMGWPSVAEVQRELEAHRRHQARRAQATLKSKSPVDLPIENLRRDFRLTEVQVGLLLAAAAPALAVDMARLYAFAWSDFAVKIPFVGFLCELMADDVSSVDDLVRQFRDHSPLVRYRLVALGDVAGWGAPTPLLHRSVSVPERVIAYLHGHEEPLARDLAHTCSLDVAADAPPRSQLVLDADTVKDLEIAATRAVADPHGRPRLLLVGAPGAGRRTALWALLKERGWGLLTVNLDGMEREPQRVESMLVKSAREALLRRCVLHVRGDNVLTNREELGFFSHLLNKVINPHEGPLALSTTRPEPRLHRVVADLFEVGFPLPSSADQRHLWRRALDEGRCETPEDTPAALTQRFNLTPGAIYLAVAEARSRQVLLSGDVRRVRLKTSDLSRAVRRKTDHALGAIAQPFSTTLTWEDVILPDRVMDVLREIQGHAIHREKVYDEWGFRKKLSYGRGLSCLFSGRPGTGKTMMAAILAESLGRELYRVDLSRVMSKWVGETEKNLALAFDEAERGQLVLLFDEADSLFSKRTKGGTSQDRFANLEINYLLQRMEAFDGMSILTTNNEKAIDEAFKRRLKFKVNFPVPDAELRSKLWRTMIPDAAHVGPDIAFDYLGTAFEMTGGNIRNAVVRAAFYAAEGDGIITHDLLYQAAVAEAREMGMVVRDESY